MHCALVLARVCACLHGRMLSSSGDGEGRAVVDHRTDEGLEVLLESEPAPKTADQGGASCPPPCMASLPSPPPPPPRPHPLCASRP